MAPLALTFDVEGQGNDCTLGFDRLDDARNHSALVVGGDEVVERIAFKLLDTQRDAFFVRVDAQDHGVDLAVMKSLLFGQCLDHDSPDFLAAHFDAADARQIGLAQQRDFEPLQHDAADRIHFLPVDADAAQRDFVTAHRAAGGLAAKAVAGDQGPGFHDLLIVHLTHHAVHRVQGTQDDEVEGPLEPGEDPPQ